MSTPLGYESALHQQQARDERHLEWLATAHQVCGCLVCLMGTAFLFHLTIGLLAQSGYDPTGVAGKYPSLREAGKTFTLVGSVGVVVGGTLGILNLLAAHALRERRRLTVLVAALNLMNIFLCFPLPSVLGSITLTVLARPTVKALFACNGTQTPQ